MGWDFQGKDLKKKREREEWKIRRGYGIRFQVKVPARRADVFRCGDG